VVITDDPTIVWAGNDYINHPDHRAAATAALDATFPAAGQPNLFEDLAEEGFFAHKPRKVYATTWGEEADTFVNIEDTIETKIEALRAHKSQMNGWDPEEMIRSWAAQRGKGKEMAYAEGFRVVTLVSDDEWAKLNGQASSPDGKALEIGRE
jgi:LmbE family N-acetylglucosaminyl deacetylase